MLETLLVTAKAEWGREDFPELLALVSPQKRRKIAYYRSEAAARNCLLGDVLLRAQICKWTGLSNSRLRFAKNEFGKPYLINDPHVHFNMSHAGVYIAVAIGDQPVGIDIERIRPVNLRIAEKYFAADEKHYILSQPSPALQYRAFCEIWTKKESYIKWAGVRLSKARLAMSVLQKTANTPHYQRVFADDKAICHLCRGDNEKPRQHKIEAADLKAYLNAAFWP